VREKRWSGEGEGDIDETIMMLFLAMYCNRILSGNICPGQ